MNIKEIQQKIDNMDYWDMEVLDIKATFFCDEVDILIADDEKSCWKISFGACYKVSYETDADSRKIEHVRDMKRSQLGYYAQDISVIECEKNDFCEVDLDLSIMDMHIECKEIVIEKISKDNENLFYSKEY